MKPKTYTRFKSLPTSAQYFVCHDLQTQLKMAHKTLKQIDDILGKVGDENLTPKQGCQDIAQQIIKYAQETKCYG